jgi:hypothetical protein
MSILKAILDFILKCLNEKETIALLLRLAEQLAACTDNTLDDVIVAQLKACLIK